MANMDLMAVLSTLVLVATISTTIFAVAAYVVSRGYTRRRVGGKAPLTRREAAAPAGRGAARRPVILRRYTPAVSS